MGWGGPRFEFYTTNQYNNYTDFIRREDAARVRAILRRDQQQQQSVSRSVDYKDETVQRDTATQKHSNLSEIARDAIGKQQRQSLLCKGKHPGGVDSHSRGEGPQKVARHARLRQLAQPKKLPKGACRKHMYGLCMYQSGNVVEFPVGRNGACYSPGVDRDRIVPERPSMDVVPPWIGSFSIHHISPEVALEQAQDAYYAKPGLPRSGVARAAAEASLREIKAAYPGELGHDHREEDAAQCDMATTNSLKCDTQINREYDVDDVPSVFSHDVSNGPISNTGARHIVTSPCSTKGEVMEHLKTCQLRKTAVQSGKGLPNGLDSMKGWTLPQLTHHVVMLQNDCMAKCKERTI